MAPWTTRSEDRAARSRSTRTAEDEAMLRLAGMVPLAAASRQFGAAPATLRRHIAVGECAGRKIGGRWFVNAHALERWARRNPWHGGARRRGRASDAVPARPCPCATATSLGPLAAEARLAERAARVAALPQLESGARELALDVLGLTGSGALPGECRAWLSSVVDDAARGAGEAALEALLRSLAAGLAGAPEDVLARLDAAQLRYAIELA